MLSQREPSAGPGAFSEAVEGLACIAEGFAAYLQELDAHSAVCRKFEGKAAVCEEDGELRVVRVFEHRSDVVVHLQSALRQFLSPQEYRRFRRGWSGEAAEGRQGDASSAHRTPRLVHTCIGWRSYRFLVRAEAPATSALLRVTLHVLPSGRDLPELPLRLLAETLRCHELLIPDAVATPQPVPPEKQAGLLGLREYLTRAMPPNLVASQCI